MTSPTWKFKVYSALLLCGATGAVVAAPKASTLGKKQLETLEKAVVAYQNGNLRGVLDVLLRAIGENDRAEARIDVRHLDEALQRSAQAGHIAPGEADLLAEIVELSHLRVREIMTPRVDALLLDLEDDRRRALRRRPPRC